MSINNIGQAETTKSMEKEQRKLRGLAQRRQQMGNRLLDTRQMKYNTDTGAVRAQRKERSRAKWAAKKIAEQEARNERAMIEGAERYAREMHIQKLKAKVELQQQWKMQSRMKASLNPEFDLNNPRALRQDKPARIGDHDARCGASSMQMFGGEDIGYKERMRKQAKDLQREHAIQVESKKRAAEEERSRERAYANFVQETDQIRALSSIARHRQKLQNEYTQSQINISMARTVRKEQREEKARSDALASLERQMLLNSKTLSEDRSTFETCMLGPGRVRTDHFKGFSKGQTQSIYAANAAQMQAKQARKAAERAEEAKYAAHVAQVNQMTQQQQADRYRQRKQQELQLNAEQQYQRRQHRTAQKSERDRIMKQTFSKEFFGAFGKM